MHGTAQAVDMFGEPAAIAVEKVAVKDHLGRKRDDNRA
jgi:hypothetical protein